METVEPIMPLASLEQDIGHLLSTLHRAGLEPIPEELADVLWLAACQAGAKIERVASKTPELEPEQVEPPTDTERNKAGDSPPPPPKPSAPQARHTEQQSPLYMPPTKHGGNAARAFHTPAVPMLPDALNLNRALRLLHRKVPSRRHYVLDEAATVEQIAERKTWQPLLKGAPERWFELALVIDKSRSMQVWEATLDELTRLFGYNGAFRNVRTWYLHSDGNDALLYSDKHLTRLSKAEELPAANGRRLIVLVSDCISRAWHTGSVTQDFITHWSAAAPFALLQMLPRRMWNGTALNRGFSTRLSAPVANCPSNLLMPTPPTVGQGQGGGKQTTTSFPVLTLEPEALRGWAHVLDAKGGAWINGIVFNSATEYAAKSPLPATSTPPTAEKISKRLQRFLSQASPTAQQLAAYLAAAPLSLPVMRLIQHTLLPHSRQVHLAEIFVSGLLRRVSVEGADPRLLHYDFHDSDNTRDALLRQVPAAAGVDVLEVLSDYIAHHTGKSLDFRALLADPTAQGNWDLDLQDPATRYFASVGARVLRRLGGDFGRLANHLEGNFKVKVEEQALVVDAIDELEPLTTRPEILEDLKNGADKKSVTQENDWTHELDKKFIEQQRMHPDDTTDFKFDINALPSIHPHQFVGRLDSGNALLDAIDDDDISVFGIISDGGVGKTTLVYEYLRRIIQHQPHINNRIYAWSFSGSSTFDKTEIRLEGSNEFFFNIFKFFDVTPNPQDINSSFIRPEPLLDKIRYYKSIIVLDGLESLQSTNIDTRGRLMSNTIKTFLSSFLFSTTNQRGSLIIITSRLPLPDLENSPGYTQLYLQNLSPSSGAHLLSKLGVRGSSVDLEQASSEYGGHALSIVLLGKIIVDHFPDRNIKNSIMVRNLVDTSFQMHNRHIAQARKIMEFYERIIIQKEGVILMEMMGLFHAPMHESQRKYLVNHAKFAYPLRNMTIEQWNIMAINLEEHGLLYPDKDTDNSREKWSCSPLVREYFRSKFKQQSEKNRDGYWEDAHHVLFKYFSFVAPDYPSSLAELTPLYRAIHHGCLAGEYKEALSVYRTRLLREDVASYSTNYLGAVSQDVACLMGFLTEEARIALGDQTYSWIYARMAFCQTCRGHLPEAIRYRKKQLDFADKQNNFIESANAAEELSGVYLLSGIFPEAKNYANYALEKALSVRDLGQEVKALCRLGVISYFRGSTEDAIMHFIQACTQQEQVVHQQTLLYEHGFYFRLLLLDMVSPDANERHDNFHNCQEFINNITYADILDDANTAIRKEENWIASVGLDTLIKAICFSRLGQDDSANIVF